MNSVIKNSRLMLCMLAIISACLWWEVAFAQITVTIVFDNGQQRNQPTAIPTKPNHATLKIQGGAPADEPFAVYAGYQTDKDKQVATGKTKADGTSDYIFIPRGAGPQYSITVSGKTYRFLLRGGTVRVTAQEDKMMMGIPGGALQKLNGLPLDFGTSVCVASLDGSGAVSDSLTLTNLSTT